MTEVTEHACIPPIYINVSLSVLFKDSVKSCTIVFDHPYSK